MTLHSSNDTTIVSNLIIGKLSTSEQQRQRPGSRSYLSRILGTRSFIPTFILYCNVCELLPESNKLGRHETEHCIEEELNGTISL